MYLIDSHVHLDASAFDTDRDDVVSRARRAGVANCVVPATLSRRWPQVRKITRIYSGCFPAYGLHPYFVERHTEEDLAQLAIWLEREPAVAVGECGLDYYLPELDRESQYRCFAAQLELAVQFQLPVIVHARKSLDGVILDCRRCF